MQAKWVLFSRTCLPGTRHLAGDAPIVVELEPHSHSSRGVTLDDEHPAERTQRTAGKMYSENTRTKVMFCAFGRPLTPRPPPPEGMFDHTHPRVRVWGG